uniref:Uncharacterized protein n=1 Tax=Canis lupus familiaris TaxID=9615 RepID=A0A8P0N6U7_CANLF
SVSNVFNFDASSPRSYVSPRISTPQTNTVPIKPLISTPPVSSQPKVSTPVVKQGPVSQSATQQPVTADKQQGHEPSLLEVFSAQSKFMCVKHFFINVACCIV